MYRHILIPTDGSELAHKAVVQRLALARAVGAKVAALTVEPSFNVYDLPASRVDQITGVFAEHAKHVKQHAARILSAVAEAAKAGGVECETVQVIHDHPYEAIVSAGKERRCDLIAMASQHRAGEVFSEFAAR